MSTCFVGLTAAVMIGLETNWNAPPRFDGAGYTVLARSISEGRGYRAIDHPDEPRHAHFPPGYPFTLAVVRTFAGNETWAFHLFSLLCSVAATVAAYRWFSLLFGFPTAFLMGLTLATNWVWARSGGGIQSEPLFELLSQLAILVAWKASREDNWKVSIVLGVLLGSAILTRHVAIALVGAVFLDLALARKWRNCILVLTTTGLLVTPWLVWVAWVSMRSESSSQADLLAAGAGGMISRIGGQTLFYVQRIPDQLIGPFVEVATVFRQSRALWILANTWAISGSILIVSGWLRLLRRPRRRLAGLVPLMTLGVLIVWPFTEAGRFLIPLIPCLIIGAVEGLTWILSWTCPTCSGTSRSRLAIILLMGMSLPYSFYDLAQGRSRSQEVSNRDFDSACAWIRAQGNDSHPGPVLTRHPGEVFLQTGRRALDVATSERTGSRDADPEEVDSTITRYQIAYLLVDEGRYANAPSGPLNRYVSTRADRVRKVWPRDPTSGTVSVYEVVAP